jgi:FrsA-like alpha/beta hydrolase family protein
MDSGTVPGQAMAAHGAARSRRAVLARGAAGWGAAALGLAGLPATAPHATVEPAAAGATAPPGPALPHQPPGLLLFAAQDLNAKTLEALGAAGYGCSEVGEIVAAVAAINATGPSYQAYYGNFLVKAESAAGLAVAALKAGHWASARSAFLRAATYYGLCLYVVLGTSSRSHEADVYTAMQGCWDSASQLFDPPLQRVRIPYGASWLPGYFLCPDSSGVRRPTVILNNGSDGQNIDLFAFGGAAATERGYNALIFEGPGQGGMLMQRQVFLRPDWEHVITPVVNYLLTRPDVDPGRIALAGRGTGAAAVIRAAAFEHRLAAVVADPGVLDAWLAWPAPLRAPFARGAASAEVNRAWRRDILPRLSAGQRFALAKGSEPFGGQFLAAARAGRPVPDLFALGQAVMRLNCGPVAARVQAPTLVTSYQLDQVCPGQAARVYSLLRASKQLHTFTAAQGAAGHGGPMAPQTRNQVVFDWLAAHL